MTLRIKMRKFFEKCITPISGSSPESVVRHPCRVAQGTFKATSLRPLEAGLIAVNIGSYIRPARFLAIWRASWWPGGARCEVST
jgi:hypothetical protein